VAPSTYHFHSPYQQKSEKYAPYEQPLANIEGNRDTTWDVFAIVEYLIRPGFCSQHRDASEDIRQIDEKGFEDNGVEEEISADLVNHAIGG
jgi:hypothetical protein